jgi:hypothetical protein
LDVDLILEAEEVEKGKRIRESANFHILIQETIL